MPPTSALAPGIACNRSRKPRTAAKDCEPSALVRMTSICWRPLDGEPKAAAVTTPGPRDAAMTWDVLSAAAMTVAGCEAPAGNERAMSRWPVTDSVFVRYD